MVLLVLAVLEADVEEFLCAGTGLEESDDHSLVTGSAGVGSHSFYFLKGKGRDLLFFNVGVNPAHKRGIFLVVSVKPFVELLESYLDVVSGPFGVSPGDKFSCAVEVVELVAVDLADEVLHLFLGNLVEVSLEPESNLLEGVEVLDDSACGDALLGSLENSLSKGTVIAESPDQGNVPLTQVDTVVLEA